MSNEEKKLTIKRIIIFMILAYIPNYVLEIAFSDHEGGMTSGAAGFTVMIYPALANILTRIITKEGVEEHYLKAHFGKNKRMYTIAALLPLVWGLLNLFAAHFLFDSSTDMGALLKENTEGAGMKGFIPIVLMAYITSIPLIFMGFGEEFGWRAYLTPKLEKLMPRGAACCVTGVIWAVWHAPLIWYGYDFGRDYPGFPYVGILAMCAVCIPLSYMLTWMTEKTKSVYPAAICHMAIDKVMNLSVAAMVSKEVLKNNSLLLGLLSIGLIPTIVSAAIVISKRSAPKKA